MIKMFGDFRSVKELEREMCRGYDLEYFDRDSLKEIEKMINLNAYSDKDTVRDHMQFLERLLFKIQSIRLEEIKEGFPTLELDEAMSEINMLFKKLTNTIQLVHA